MRLMRSLDKRNGKFKGKARRQRSLRYVIEQFEQRLHLSATFQLAASGTQTPTVIGNSNGIQVSSSSDGLREAESAIAVDPSNPMYVAAVTVDGLNAISLFRSADAGATWTETVINKASSD